MREQIQITAKLYQCQETAQKFYKEEYQDKIKWYKETLNKYAKLNKTDTLKAVISICQKSPIKENGMSIMMFMAAAVEIIEPSKK